MREFYDRMLDLLYKHHVIAVATLVEAKGSTPRDSGAKMVILPDGSIHGSIGGGGFEKLVIEEALEAMEGREGFFKEYDLVGEEDGGIGSACGGRVKVLVEVISTPDRLLICGGGHIGLALAHMARLLDMQVWVVDPRDEFSDPGRFPDGVVVIKDSPASESVRALIDSNTSVVLLTHSHELDKEVLRVLATTGAAYIGMIGSKRKVKMIMKELKEDGLEPGALERVHAPVGLDIGSETPAEIALSILSEMVHVRRKGGPSSISLK